MKTFIVIAALAVICGVTFLAFKRPRAYRRVSPPLRNLIALAFVASSVWSMGVLHGADSMTPYLKEGQLKEAHRVTFEKVEFISDITPVVLVVLAYFLLIPPLLRLLKKDEQEEMPE